MKTLLKIILYMALLLILIGGIGLFYIDSVVKAGINKFGPEITQTNVHLNNLSTSLLKAKLTLNGLEIGNPKGFSEPYALTLGSISVAADRDSLLSDTIIITHLDISKINVTYELSGKQNNLAVLNENISHYLGSDKKQAESAQPEKSGKKKVIIKKLTVRGAEIKLAVNSSLLPQTVQAGITLPDIVLTNIGEGKTMTIGEISAYILNLISLNSIDALAKSAYKNVINLSEKMINQTKGATSQLVDTAKETVNTLKDAGHNLDQSFKSLFKQ